MRKLIYAINVTLDGCCEHTKMMADEELLDFYTQLIRGVDLFVYGRKTYEIMVPCWPDVAKSPSETRADREFAEAFCSAGKVVFSRSLKGVDDGNTRIVRTDLKEEMVKLKQLPGKDIMAGGVDLSSQLIALDLVDEYRIVIQPILVGEGRRLLEGTSLPEKRKLKLVESRTLKSGSVALHYSKL